MDAENIYIRLLGVPTIEIDAVPVTSFRSNRIPALLGLLVSRPGPWQREVLASILWPDHMPNDGRHNLRQVVLYLKQLIGDNAVSACRNTLELSSTIETDFSDLEKFNSPFQSPEELEAAAHRSVEGYRGEFLQGYDEEWVFPVRAHCVQTYVNALLFLSNHLCDFSPSKSVELAERAILAEPYMEAARASKIMALKRSGEHAQAHMEFSRYKRLLADELGIEPSLATANALLDVAAPEPESKSKRSGGEPSADSLGFLLGGNRPRNGLDLAIAEADFWIGSGQAGIGIERLNLALKANGSRSTSASYCMAKVALAEMYFVTGDSYKAKEIISELLPSLGDSRAKVRALILLGRMYSYSYQPHLATEYIGRALELADSSGDVEDRVDAFRTAAEIAFQLESFEVGEEYSRTCIDLCRQIGDWQSFAYATSGLALIRFRNGQTEEAKDAVLAGLDALADKHTSNTVSVRVRLYRVLEEMGQVDLAEAGYRAGIAGAEKFGNLMVLAIALTYLGDLLTVKGDYDVALGHHEMALEIRKKLSEALGIATSLRGIGRILRAQGRFSEAKETLRESASLFLSCEAMPGHASALLELAHVTREIGDAEMALKIAVRSRDLLLGMSSHLRQTIGPTGARLAEDADKLVHSLLL